MNALLFGRDASPRTTVGSTKNSGLRDMSFIFWSGNPRSACAYLSQSLKIPSYSWERKCQHYSFNGLSSSLHRIIIATSLRTSLGLHYILNITPWYSRTQAHAKYASLHRSHHCYCQSDRCSPLYRGLTVDIFPTSVTQQP